MSELAEVKAEVKEWDASDIVEALSGVQKARSKTALVEALHALHYQLEEKKGEVDDELEHERERVEALEAASEAMETLLDNTMDAINRLEE